MSFFNSFVGQALSDKSEPSSKRLIGFVIVCFALIMEGITTFIPSIEFGFDVFVLCLVSGLTSLGISGIEKFSAFKK